MVLAILLLGLSLKSLKLHVLPFTFPYSMNFDNQTVNQPPECWAEYNSWNNPNATAHVETVFPCTIRNKGSGIG